MPMVGQSDAHFWLCVLCARKGQMGAAHIYPRRGHCSRRRMERIVP